MRPIFHSSFGKFLAASFTAFIVVTSSAQAVAYYWDTDGTTAGFGTASGTWGTSQFWSTNTAGTAAPTVINPLVADTLNFGNGATGLAAGTINVGATATGTSLTFASGSGAIALSGGTITLAAASTITVNNATDSISSVLAGGATSVTKAGTGSLTLTGANTYTGAFNLNAGTLVIGATNTLKTTGSALVMNSAGSATGASLDLSSFSQTVGSFAVRNTATSSANADTVTIGSGQALTVNGGVTIGSATTGTTTFATFTGAGAFNVVSSGGIFQVGGVTATGTNASTLDMSNLATFSANLGSTGTFRVGDNNAGSGSTSGASTAILAQTSTITAGTLDLGGQSAGSVVETLKLGSTSNTINATTIHLGLLNDTSSRSSGQILFNSGTGSLTLRGNAGGSTRVTTFNVINDNNSTSATVTGLVDLSGHSSDLMIASLNIAKRSGGAGAIGNATGTFTFDTGTFDVTTIDIASRALSGSAAGGTSSGTLNIGGGTSIIGGITAATYSFSGSGTNGSANAVLNFTGGTITLNGNISKGTANANAVATLNLDGAALDMTNHSIGGATLFDNLNFKSGTLQNVAQINNGAGLTKTTTGTLIIGGTNTYTGTTAITAGTLQVDGSLASGSTVAVGTSGTLSGSGTISGNATLTGSGVISSSGTIAGTLGVTGGNWNGTGSVTGVVTSSSGTFTVGSSGNLHANGGLNVTGGTLAGTGTITGSVNYTSSSSSSYGGVIAGSGKTLTMNNSSGTLTLTGINTYSGATTVTAGKLVVNGQIASSAITVNSGGSLGGSGTVGALTVTSGGDVGPGNSPGILTSGDFNLQSGGSLSIQVNGPGVGTDYDQLAVNGTVALNGTLSLTTTGYTPVNGTLLFILANDGTDAIAGNFTGMAEGSFISIGSQAYEITYLGDSSLGSFTGGNDVALMAVPEPGPAFLGGIGMLLLLRRRRG